MRVAASRSLRVGRGDEIVIRGQLPRGSRLSRLYIFARQGKADFSPYVPNLEQRLAVNGPPQIMSPVSFRLTERNPASGISFTSDIDGAFQILQEVDNAAEPKAKVTLKRRICPDLPWIQRIYRQLSGILPWNS